MLVKIGYIHDFNIHEECIDCHQTNFKLSPTDFQIDKVYRFEGESNPDDESILYVISSPKFNIKGTLVNGHGISSNQETDKVIEKLLTHATPITPDNKKHDGAGNQ